MRHALLAPLLALSFASCAALGSGKEVVYVVEASGGA